jgi:hypothetical protein
MADVSLLNVPFSALRKHSRLPATHMDTRVVSIPPQIFIQGDEVDVGVPRQLDCSHSESWEKSRCWMGSVCRRQRAIT